MAEIVICAAATGVYGGACKWLSFSRFSDEDNGGDEDKDDDDSGMRKMMIIIIP